MDLELTRKPTKFYSVLPGKPKRLTQVGLMFFDLVILIGFSCCKIV